jgi:hypothetical protein
MSLRFRGRVLGEAVIFFRCHLRKSLDERDDVPDLIVIVNFAVGGHSTHLDPIFNDPELQHQQRRARDSDQGHDKAGYELHKRAPHIK